MRYLPSMIQRVMCLAMIVCVINGSWLSVAQSAEPTGPSEITSIEFNRDIRPILSENCLHCHGPDSATREADLRLDDENDVLKKRDSYHILVPGQPDQSELYQRIVSSDESTRMPPHESDKSLSPKEIDLIGRWISQGGKYQKHWSFIPPKKINLPAVAQAAWVRNAIDRFILARLEKENLAPSPRAEKGTLLRRVSIDLTGLPPTVDELDAFLADNSPDAYEKVVDRLLNSKQFGEQRARFWLDATRFADTAGFFEDNERTMWRWRDWVIDAFNANMPFDQFTIEQLAGDLLPKPTQSQLIATGMNRNHMTTIETGVIDEEYRVEYVVDRLHTTSTIWLGLTVGCARCHDHKYDPISQKEFYQLFAYFNNVAEKGNSGSTGNVPPILNVPTADYSTRLEQLQKQIAEATEQHQAAEKELAKLQATWETNVASQIPEAPADDLVIHYPFDGKTDNLADKSLPATSNNKLTYDDGLLNRSLTLDGDVVLETGNSPRFDRDDTFALAAWIKPASSGPACIISQNDDLNGLRGFDLMIRKGKLIAHFIHQWNSNAIQVVTTNSLATGQWQHVMVTYDGSSKAAGVKLYVDGQLQKVTAKHDSLSGSFTTDEPFRIGRRSTSASFKGQIDDVRVYARELAENEVSQLVTAQLLGGLLNVAPDERAKWQQQKLKSFYLANFAPEQLRAAHSKWTKLQSRLKSLQKNIPTTMVMQENEKQRDTFLLLRGEYDQHGEKLAAGVPNSLTSFPTKAPANRLGLVQWLMDPQHPLTARVTVNRFWQQIFGTGIVKTVDDFGSQGEWPTHPELLDWLAVEFVESGWDVKHLLKLIVMSNTYQQTSKITPAILERDPENRLLARGPRFRFDAEVVRDSALKISGLLVERIGGPSVKPYQPAGLWEAVSYDGNLTYETSQSGDLYRRSLYTFWKRQSPPPAMMVFDAPTRETCTVRRPRTNTPLQALVLMNDPTYMEAARKFAERILSFAPSSKERIDYACRVALSRRARANEIELLTSIYEKQLNVFRKDIRSADKILSVGDSPTNPDFDTAEHAAWAIIASLILNLDETVTKN